MILSTHAKDSVPALYQTARQCDDAEERCRLLKKAAEAGYIPAICDYGLIARIPPSESIGSLRRPAKVMSLPCTTMRWLAAMESDGNDGCCRRPGTATSRRCTSTAWIATILLKPCTGCVKPHLKVIALPLKPAPYGARNRRDSVPGRMAIAAAGRASDGM